MKNLFTIATLVLAITFGNAQKKINGISFPSSTTVGGKKLSLNGVAVRKKLFLKLYSAGLYTSKKTNNGPATALADQAIAFRMVITSRLITEDNMSESIMDGIKIGAGKNFATIKNRAEKMANVFKKAGVTVGDTFDIKYSPGVGTHVFKNNKLKTTIKGLDFKKAMFGMWLNNESVDPAMTQGLLDK